MRGTADWLPFAFLAALFAAGVAIFGKLAATRGDVINATVVRSLIMSAVLLGVMAVRGRTPGPWIGDGRAWLFVALAGACGAASWLAYFWALERGPVGPVAVIDRLSVVFTFALAWLVLGERYGWRVWLGLALVVCGAMMILSEPAPPKPAAGAATQDGGAAGD